MSFFTYLDLLKGRRAQHIEKHSRLTKLRNSLNHSRTVATNPALCDQYAKQFLMLKEACTQIGANDLWIARHNATLVKHNNRELTRISGLRLED